jgi:L-2-hydroxyglutarate oxidase
MSENSATMLRETYHFVVVGGGIIGLSTAMHLLQEMPWARVAVLDKESKLATHQTGNNSGVIHAGIYYKPGSLKAKFAAEGSRTMVEFCQKYDLPMKVCGKVIVATEPDELPRLEKLYERGIANGLKMDRLDPSGIKEHEPACAGLAGIFLHSTGITDYSQVCEQYAKIIRELGGEILTSCALVDVHNQADGVILSTTSGELKTDWWINCGGLHCDRIAAMAGVKSNAKIVPFRGEYYELKPDRRHLVKGLIYPVPDPSFPFLGVHFTRMIDGSVHCGPNAVLALKREGYTKRDISLADMYDTLSFPGFWKMIRKNLRMGLSEIRRSFSVKLFARSLQRLVPEVQQEDLIPAHAGVRAQAMLPDGSLVDDFLIVDGPRSIHVLNAPSPAATASLPIGRTIVERLPAEAKQRQLVVA